MTSHPNTTSVDRSGFPKISVLGLLLFLLGSPNLGRTAGKALAVPESNAMVRYVMVALIAGALASIVEFSVLTHA